MTGAPAVRRRAGRLAVPLVLAVLSAGCVTGEDVLTGRAWTLASMDGLEPVAEATVTFGADGRFAIDTGCSTGDGRYHVEGNRVLLDSEALSTAPCEEPMVTQEGMLLHVLSVSPTYAIDTGTGRLRLTTPAGVVLLFDAP